MQFDVSISVRVGASARGGDGQIQSARERLRNSGQLNEFRQVGVAEIKVQSKGVALLKFGPGKLRAGVEVHGTTAMNQGPVAGGDMSAGELDGAGERVPVNRTRGTSRGRRQGGIKIVDLEIPADGKRGELAAGAAGKICPAMNHEGQIWRPIIRPVPRTISGFEQGRPFLQVVARDRETQR